MCMRTALPSLAKLFGSFVVSTVLGLFSTQAFSHSVGQVQTTKYFAPETVQMLADRLQSGGTPGFQSGDIVTYIIQFTPIGNGANVGVAGYITDYIPPGAEVVGADIVQPDGSGGFTAVAPTLPGGIDSGWGDRGQNTFAAPFNVNGYDPTGRCTAIGGTLDAPSCNARITELYADTGIFFSTDPRTMMFPSFPTRIAQGTNGYYVNPTGGANLNTLLGQTNATTHNLWDAQQTNAFGTSTLPGLTPNANGSQGILISAGRIGQGSTPYYAGSAVAGPQTGYQLDSSASIGPWQRISYAGSRMGDASTGPATAAGSSTTAIGGFTTNAGWSLSTSNPLPSNTNAVRWAVGKLVVGDLNYVRIKLRLTAAPPVGGLVNSSEVFGGDAGDGDDGKDNPWRYHVPSVADNNSNLFILKKVIGVCSSATLATAKSCTPVDNGNGGAVIPAQYVKLRYQITYLNSGNSTQTNVQLSDLLPHLGSVRTLSAGNVYIKSGADIRTASVSGTGNLSNNGAAVGAVRSDVNPTDLVTITPRQTANFQTIASLPGGGGGVVEMDVVVGRTGPAVLVTGDQVSNTAKLATTAVPGGVTSVTNSSVTNTATLLVSKAVSSASAAPGGTVTYTITIQNVGNATATSIVVDDVLPFTGTTADATRRFSFVVGSSVISGLTTVVPTVVGPPPTLAGYTGNANQQQVKWTFASSLAAGATATITFDATIGANVPASITPYTNDVVVSYNNGTDSVNTSATNQSPVIVTVPLTVTKTLDCVYTSGTCVAYTNGPIPTNAKVRYKIVYANTSGAAQTNVYVCDQLTSTQGSPALSVTVAAASTGTPAVSDSPSIGVPGSVGSPNAACGFSSSTNAFSYPVIVSLAAGASGTVYVDVTTNAADSSTLTNTAKVVSTEYPGGASSSVANSVYNLANLVVSKSTSTPTISPSGTATYTITITNTGNQTADNIKVYDFLPFATSPSGSTGRFNYVSTSSYGGTVPGSPTPPTITTASSPTQPSHSGNTNQQQVLWTFPAAGTLAPGASFTIIFTASAGSALVPGSTIYTNDVEVSYKSGTSTLYTGVNNTAPVTIPSNLTISKTIDCVFNSAGTVCNAYNGSGLIPTNAKVRYRINYANTSGAAQSVYLCDQLPTQITGFGAVSTPSIAPTPAGPYLDSPALGSRTNPANAACGLSGTNFSYPLYNLPANSSGNVWFDVQTNAASGATVTNLGKIVNSVTGANESSSVTATAIDVPNLVITKSTSTPSRAPGDTATYTISITNNGNAATTSLKVYDLLPYAGTVDDSTKRFSYASTSGYTGGLPVPTITTNRPPTLSPYNSNINQQQVTWDFGSYALAPGSTVTITFTASVGSAMPTASYYNSAIAEFDSTGGVGSAGPALALVSVTTAAPSLLFMKTLATYSDPVNGTTSPYNIPGAEINYTLRVTNTGNGAVDSNTITIVDPIPANTELFTGNLSGGAPFIFTDSSSPSSGLACGFTALGNFADCVDFSTDGTTWNVFTPNGGYDPAVTHIRFKPTGAMAADAVAGSPSPYFDLTFRVRVK